MREDPPWRKKKKKPRLCRKGGKKKKENVYFRMCVCFVCVKNAEENKLMEQKKKKHREIKIRKGKKTREW